MGENVTDWAASKAKRSGQDFYYSPNSSRLKITSGQRSPGPCRPLPIPASDDSLGRSQLQLAVKQNKRDTFEHLYRTGASTQHQDANVSTLDFRP